MYIRIYIYIYIYIYTYTTGRCQIFKVFVPFRIVCHSTPLRIFKLRKAGKSKVEILIQHSYPFSNYFNISLHFVVIFVSSYLYYLHPRTSAHPPTKTFIILAFHLTTFDNPLLFIVHRPLLSLIVHVQSTRNWLHGALINYTLGSTMPPSQPSHHSPLSVDPPLLPSSSLIGPLPCSSSTLPHINKQTYIHLNKLPPAYITSIARSRHAPTHLSLLTATLLLCEDI